jgi:hypothetical protein
MRGIGDRKPIVDPKCAKCSAKLVGAGTRPVDNVAIIVCENHVEWGRDNILTGGEVIVLPRRSTFTA